MMSGNELISEVRTRAMGLETCTRFLILDMCDRFERKTRDCELLRQKVVKLLPQKPKTNADRIRAMTDEELAVFLRTVEYDVEQFPFIQDWDKWLKEPAEGDA